MKKSMTKKEHDGMTTDEALAAEPETPVEQLEKKDESTMDLNKETNSNEHSQDEKEKLEKDLSKDNIVARVVSWTGNYLKVKFLRDGKPFTTYKGKNGSPESAKEALDTAIKSEEKANS